jgi:hypothetical protein
MKIFPAAQGFRSFLGRTTIHSKSAQGNLYEPQGRFSFMVVAQIGSGLGNQMFQYAAARRISALRGVPLKLDIRGFQNDRLRCYQLDAFNIAALPASEEELRQCDKANPQLLVNRVWRRLTPWIAPHRRYYFRERTFCFDAAFERIKGDAYLVGQWQSEKFFKPIAGSIRKDFTLKREPTGENAALIGAICTTEAVSVHVRRGDYITDPVAMARNGFCSRDYYVHAIRRIVCQVQRPHFFVFSDDPEWRMQNLQIGQPTTHVRHNGPDQGPEDLRLMSFCKHHIIANSTFSWWGAWLGQNSAKVVIAPQKWFANAQFDTRDVIPSEWQTL